MAAHPELIDADGTESRIPSFWNHMNSIDYNAALDQIMLSVRGNSEVWIIDHSTTMAEAAGHTGGKSGKGGDLLYRWGNPKAYGAGTQSDQKLYQQHDAEWIPAGYPGAGNITVFNNGLGRNYSTIDEFTPPVDAAGNYALVTGKAFGPTDFTWTYKANPPASLFAEAISGAQRLPNGNTLIDDGTHGTFIEVTPGGETVWKYVNSRGARPGRWRKGRRSRSIRRGGRADERGVPGLPLWGGLSGPGRPRPDAGAAGRAVYGAGTPTRSSCRWCRRRRPQRGPRPQRSVRAAWRTASARGATAPCRATTTRRTTTTGGTASASRATSAHDPIHPRDATSACNGASAGAVAVTGGGCSIQ